MANRALGGLVIAIAAHLQMSAAVEAASAITLVPVLGGLSVPVFVTHAGDGSQRLFVVEQPGVIKILPSGQTTPTVFLDITARVLFSGEQGLLGLAFHPQTASNRRFFVNYTRRPDGATVIAEYLVSPTDPDVADPLSERVLLVIPQPFANHNGGMIAFGPDGWLYIATGDGGGVNERAQDIDDLLGKILRIDVDTSTEGRAYSTPASNPFVGATAGADEVFAYGFRNPWRFAFDRATGDLYVGDVGQSALEEIDVVIAGGNYGWGVWEGTRCTSHEPAGCDSAGFVFPLAEYEHVDGRCAVIGGYVYRGRRGTLPQGGYVAGDLCTGEIFVTVSGTTTVALEVPLAITSFGEDEAGELYVVGNDTVQRIAPVATCRRPDQPCAVVAGRSAGR
jgi:glucose/arabinose dehydrogenase